MKPGTAPMKRTAFACAERVEAREAAKVIIKEKKIRMRKCAIKTCRKPFDKRSMTHKVCGPECAQELARLERESQERKYRQAGLIALKPRKWWLAKAKAAMHLFVRLRDEGGQCCSCDTILVRIGRIGGDYDAGHLRSVGSAKHLEFDPRNVWGQCKYCNDRLHGNEREYERRLRIKMGNPYVDGLMEDNEPRHLKIADFQAIEAHYKQKIKELKAAAAPAAGI